MKEIEQLKERIKINKSYTANEQIKSDDRIAIMSALIKLLEEKESSLNIIAEYNERLFKAESELSKQKETNERLFTEEEIKLAIEYGIDEKFPFVESNYQEFINSLK